jgi:hypothetical protein
VSLAVILANSLAQVRQKKIFSWVFDPIFSSFCLIGSSFPQKVDVVKTKCIENERGILLNMGLFLRKVCRTKDGKSHHYWVLLESFRTARGPRHRTVAYLGEMDEGGRLGIRQVAEDSPGYQMSLLDASIPEWVEVDV